MKITDTHVYFYGGMLSNWYHTPFTDKAHNITFLNAEQAFMFYKARFFGADEIAGKILITDSPAEVKKLGRLIQYYDNKAWNLVRVGIMVWVNYLKFASTLQLTTFLLDTRNRILVEASPVDKIWGVGLAEDDPLILDEKNWQGKNLLGKVLMEVREMSRT